MSIDKKYQGVDADLETSLEEYGFVARPITVDYGDEYFVIYKIGDNQYGSGHIREIELNELVHGISFADEDDIKSMLDFVGLTKDEWFELPFITKFSDLISYWGTENIMGTDYYPNDKKWAFEEIGLESDNDADNEMFAKGGMVKVLDEIKKNGFITENQINLIKRRLNSEKEDSELDDLIEYINNNSPKLSNEQNQKGYEFLMNLWKSPTGKERKNSPFGYREQSVLENFEYFELAGFYSIYGVGSIPVYNVIGKSPNTSFSGSFQYYYDGNVNIIGEDGGMFAKGGGVKLPKDAKIRINYVDVSVYKDSYEDGETDNVNNYDMNHIKGSIVTPKELVSFLAKNIYTSEDASDYSILDNNIHTSQLQDADGSEASESEIERWKKGDLELYSANFVISVSIISEIDFDDETLSSITGIGVYKKGGKVGKYAKGGGVNNMSYENIYEVLKDKIDNSIDDLDRTYENSSDFKGEEVEHKFRDGFIPYTNGGYEASWFEYVSTLNSTGYSLPTEKLQAEMQRHIDYAYELAKDTFKETYPEIVDVVGEDNIDYNSLDEAGFTDEAQELSDWEMENISDEDSIYCSITAYYYEPTNDRGQDGKHTISLQGVINLEAPYHRAGKNEDFKEIIFTFDSIEELDSQMNSSLKEIIDWFNGSKPTESDDDSFAKGGNVDEIVVKSGNNGKLKVVFKGVKNQKNELQSNEVFEEEKSKGKSVFLFVNDELYDEFIADEDEDEYAKGGGVESKYKVGQKFYDTRYDRTSQIVSTKRGLITWKRFNKTGTEFENNTEHSLVENQFDYLVQMGAYQLSKQYADGGKVKTKSDYALRDINDRGISIKQMDEILDEKFPDSFGFKLLPIKDRRNLIADYSKFDGIQDKSIKIKFDKNHSMHISVYQGSENTYFEFLVTGSDGEDYIGSFGFKDEGNVPSEYITSFTALLYDLYGYPFNITHEVYKRGGDVHKETKAEQLLDKAIDYKWIDTDMGSGWNFTLEAPFSTSGFGKDILEEESYLDYFDPEDAGIEDYDNLSKEEKEYYFEDWKETLFQSAFEDFKEKSKKHLDFFVEYLQKDNDDYANGGQTITRTISYKDGGLAGLVDEEQMRDISFKIKVKTMPKKQGVLLHELVTIEEYEARGEKNIKLPPFHLIYGDSSLAIFDAFGMNEIAGLKREDAVEHINNLKKQGKTERDGSFMAGLTNFAKDEIFMFFNVERLNFKGFANRVLPHEALHLARYLISLYKNEWMRNNLNTPNWWEDKRATFVDMNDDNEEFFAETLERTTAIAMDGWFRVTGSRCMADGGDIGFFKSGGSPKLKFFNLYDSKTKKTLKVYALTKAMAKILAEEIDYNDYEDGEKIDFFDWFWNFDYRHYLRDASPKQRSIVKQKFIDKGLKLDGSSPQHAYIVISTIKPSELKKYKKVGSDGINFKGDWAGGYKFSNGGGVDDDLLTHQIFFITDKNGVPLGYNNGYILAFNTDNLLRHQQDWEGETSDFDVVSEKLLLDNNYDLNDVYGTIYYDATKGEKIVFGEELKEPYRSFYLKQIKENSFANGGGVDDADWIEESLIDLQNKVEIHDLVVKNAYNNYYVASNGDAEFIVFETEEDAREFAIERVKEDLQENPEYFNRDWLMNYVDGAFNYFNNLYFEMNENYVNDIESEDSDEYENRLVEEMVENGIISDEEAKEEDFDYNDYKDDFIVLLTDEKIDEGNDGLDYYINNFGEEQAFKIILDNGLIDIEKASEGAIDEDGIAHFIAPYDSTELLLNDSKVAYRTN